MQFKKDVEVISSEGEKIGALDRVVMNPKTRDVAYLVVKSGFLLTEDKLIPIDLLGNADEHRITVMASKAKLDELPRFEEVHYIRSDEPRAKADDVETYYWYPPAMGLHSMGQYPVFPQLFYIPVTGKNIPDNTVALKEGAKVITNDDKHVGNIESMLVDESSDHVTHLVVSSGVFLKEKKLVPTYWLINMSEDEVHLAVASSFVDSLPDYPVEGGRNP